MARPPAKRRGIMLDPRADTAESLTNLTQEPAVADLSGHDQASISGLIERMERLNAEQQAQIQRQAEQLQTQLQELERQREQLARQVRPRRSGLGVSLVLTTLAVASVSIAYYWPQLQDAGSELNRVSTDMVRVGPQLQAVRERVDSLSRGVEAMTGTVATVREEVTTLRSDLGSLRQAVDTRQEKGGATRTTGAGATPAAFPRNASAMNDRYRGGRRMMPW